MSRRLGESLVTTGMLSEEQLQRAVTDQLVFGGHLGTSLLELGYLGERELGESMATVFGVPYVDFEALSRVPYEVTRAFPAKLAEKHRVVPLRQEGRRLVLAMVDPTNILALDEIAFVTGYRIAPSLALEVRVLQALERYYNVPRSQRFVMLGEELSRRRLQSPNREVAVGTAGSTRARSVDESRVGADTDKIRAARVGATTGSFDSGEKYGYGRSWRDVADSMETGTVDLGDEDSTATDTGDGRSERQIADTRPRRAQPPGGVTPGTMGDRQPAERRLAMARRVDEVLGTVIEEASVRTSHCMLFVLKEREAVLWSSRLSTDPARSIVRFNTEESILSLVETGESHYLGGVPRRKAFMDFFDKVGLSIPENVLIIPIRIRNRDAAFLYADAGEEPLDEGLLPAMLRLAMRAGFALQILILRKKILSS